MLVRDGIIYFLSRISYGRMREAILAQVQLPLECEPGERLLHLALHFPTLHKLGQIIARKPGIDPGLKGWLAQLETGVIHCEPSDIFSRISALLEDDDSAAGLQLSPCILAEASVSAVIPFTWREPGHTSESVGVFKVLKKKVGAHLAEELRLLAETVVFLERDGFLYGLQEMMLADLFARVRESLAKEVDLAAERENLVEAARVYAAVKEIRIPRLLSFRTPYLTAMEYMDGVRITDARLTAAERQVLARQAFQAVICIPLFSAEESALFHGDPHAGNILAVTGGASKTLAIALIDWTLAGRLSKDQRWRLVEMMIGITIGDNRMLREAISLLCGGWTGSVNVEALLGDSSIHHVDPLKTAFHLLEEMTMAGMVMPPELILFRKAFFTLEGVLNDLSPDFSMGEAISDYISRLVLAELPRRVITGLLPVPDTALGYCSLLSNEMLANLTLHCSLAVWNKAMSSQLAIFEAQTRFSVAFLESGTIWGLGQWRERTATNLGIFAQHLEKVHSSLESS